MKHFLALMLLIASASAFAMPWPNVYNFGNSVQLHIANDQDRQIWCSGYLTLQTNTGKDESQYVTEFIMAHNFIYRNFYPRTLGETFTNVYHSIYCN